MLVLSRPALLRLGYSKNGSIRVVIIRGAASIRVSINKITIEVLWVRDLV